ncbi:MAG TPA: preprotein translocase subunit SecG [Croceibacterium sp.]|nr:preprotein translocase subunit SecG [Croceibacterium sp.]
MFLFLTVIQAIVAAALVGVVLMQRSEGGGLGIGGGGSPGGLMSARGAADFLTRTTKWLAVLFVVLAILIGGVAVNTTSGGEIDTSLDRTVVPASDPLAPVANPAGDLNAPVVAPPAASPSAQGNDPLADVAQ